jgi:hypothetical protein
MVRKRDRSKAVGHHKTDIPIGVDLSDMRMLNEWVLVEPVPDDDMVGLLKLPASVKNNTVENTKRFGTVLSIGPDCDLPMEIGDRILYCVYFGKEVGELRVLEPHECLAVQIPD